MIIIVSTLKRLFLDAGVDLAASSQFLLELRRRNGDCELDAMDMASIHAKMATTIRSWQTLQAELRTMIASASVRPERLHSATPEELIRASQFLGENQTSLGLFICNRLVSEFSHKMELKILPGHSDELEMIITSPINLVVPESYFDAEVLAATLLESALDEGYDPEYLEWALSDNPEEHPIPEELVGYGARIQNAAWHFSQTAYFESIFQFLFPSIEEVEAFTRQDFKFMSSVKLTIFEHLLDNANDGLGTF